MKLAPLLAAAAGLGALACTGLLAQTGPEPASPRAEGDEPISGQAARATAAELAGLLEKDYVFPDIAKKYAGALRTKAAAGGYDDAGTTSALAEQLTADLRAVSPDNHLRVFAGGPGGGPGPRPMVVRSAPGAGAPATGPAPAPQMQRPQAIEHAGWIAPGVAFVRFNVFPPDGDVTAAAERFMRDHADAKTIIFDIRTHGGGGLDQMDAILPYLFAKETGLVMMDTRASVDRAGGNPLEGSRTLRLVPTNEDVVRREHVAIPHASEKRLWDAKVFVLTSGYTGSAAEHFALSLKRTGRATLIGEATGGAGHYGGVRPVGDKFAVFIPVGRTFDQDTGKGWEGDGVSPHIAVPAERALVEALTRSGVGAAEAEKLSAKVAPTRPMSRPRRNG
jgi:hypothetical protein